jgi:hypothetical protein
MGVEEQTGPDLHAIPDTCGVWRLQGCTVRGLDWLAAEVSGDPELAFMVLDEHIAQFADEARDAGLVVVIEAPPLDAD